MMSLRRGGSRNDEKIDKNGDRYILTISGRENRPPLAPWAAALNPGPTLAQPWPLGGGRSPLATQAQPRPNPGGWVVGALRSGAPTQQRTSLLLPAGQRQHASGWGELLRDGPQPPRPGRGPRGRGGCGVWDIRCWHCTHTGLHCRRRALGGNRDECAGLAAAPWLASWGM